MAEEKHGGILKMAVVRNPVGFGDPLNIRGQDQDYAQVTMQHLIEIDGKGGYLPLLAESWTLASDKSAYTFKLRKGVKFHDGTEFDAPAAKFNLDRGMASKCLYMAQTRVIIREPG